MSNPKWFKHSKPTCSIVPIRRFVNEHTFGLKNGGYGCMFTLAGIDDEGQTDEVVEDAVKRVEGAIKSLPEIGRLYQYARIRKGFDIPFQDAYQNPRVATAVRDRIAFLDETANFRRIELFWVVTVEPHKENSFGSKSLSPAQYERQTVRSIAQVERTAEILTAQLSDILGLRLLAKDEVASFFGYLLNLESWSLGLRLRSAERVDTQLVQSSVEWHDEHLRVGKQYVQLFSLLDSPGGSRPNLFAPLLSIDANIILCSVWVPRSRTDVQKRISQLEGFAGIFKHKLLAVAANMKAPRTWKTRSGRRQPRKVRTSWLMCSTLSTTADTNLGSILFLAWFIHGISRKYSKPCPS